MSDSELLLESRKCEAKRVGTPEQGRYPEATEKRPGPQCTRLPPLCRPQAGRLPRGPEAQDSTGPPGSTGPAP